MINFKSKKLRRILLTVAELLLLAALLSGVLLVANSDFLAEIKTAIGDSGVSADALRERVGEDVSISIVYSSFDSYAYDIACDLDEQLEEKSYIKASCFDDTAYDTKMRSDLTLFLGHTLYSSEDYLSAYERLGPDGLEIAAEKDSEGNINRLFILAFNENQLKRGVESFSSYFLSASRLYKALNTLCFTEKGKTKADIPEKLVCDVDSFSILSVSYPAGDSYSSKVISTFCKEKNPDFLLFNGGIACADNRDDLSEHWKSIAASVAGLSLRTGIRISGSEESTATALAKDVAASVFDSCHVYEKENAFIMLCTEENEPLGFVFIEGSSEDGFEEKMEQYVSLAERAARHKVLSLTFMQELPASCAEQLPSVSGDTLIDGVYINESYQSFVSEEADKIYESAVKIGCNAFVFSAGYTNTGVYVTEEGKALALNGSVNFGAPGVGGGFALNNSLRGAVNITFDFSGDGNVDLSYVYASAYGLTVKNG